MSLTRISRRSQNKIRSVWSKTVGIVLFQKVTFCMTLMRWEQDWPVDRLYRLHGIDPHLLSLSVTSTSPLSHPTPYPTTCPPCTPSGPTSDPTTAPKQAFQSLTGHCTHSCLPPPVPVRSLLAPAVQSWPPPRASTGDVHQSSSVDAGEAVGLAAAVGEFSPSFSSSSSSFSSSSSKKEGESNLPSPHIRNCCRPGEGFSSTKYSLTWQVTLVENWMSHEAMEAAGLTSPWQESLQGGWRLSRARDTRTATMYWLKMQTVVRT